MLKHTSVAFYCCFLFIVSLPNHLFGQGTGTCPVNIGFERETFENWECFSGSINTSGDIILQTGGPIDGTHTLLKNSIPQTLDPYGNFPVNCPNGSGYSIRLGNSATRNEAERVSYTFTIPANQDDYGIIYNYAVVIQNPDHLDYQQPKFTSRVFDVTANQYIECGSFEFVASSNLPGFMLSPSGQEVYYKPWSPITIRLVGYAGKTIRLEFTNNDCTLGGHFGYAYLDVNENCASPITGNTYCIGAKQVMLTAPFGFREYNWFNADFSQVLGKSNVLRISPAPAPNTLYALEIIPFPGLGCLDTLYTTINFRNDSFELEVADSLIGCRDVGVNLIDSLITSGSSPGLTYEYYSDADGLSYTPTPTFLNESGTYYIKGINDAGCNDIKPIEVNILVPPIVTIKDPAAVCYPATVDITDAALTAGSEQGIVYTYFKDEACSQPVANANAIGSAGNYFVKGTNRQGCFTIAPVKVSIVKKPEFTVKDVVACGQADISTGSNVSANTSDITFAYWRDEQASVEISFPQIIQSSGTVYVEGKNTAGCTTILPLNVTINPSPVFALIDPTPVIYPATVNLTNSVIPDNSLRFTFWTNPETTSQLIRPAVIETSGTYYVKAENAFGCSLVKPLQVVVNAPPEPVISIPNAFSPNNDGINDLLVINITGTVQESTLEIFDRYGLPIFRTNTLTNYWTGNVNGKPLPPGTYYYIYNGTNTYTKRKIKKSGSVTILR